MLKLLPDLEAYPGRFVLHTPTRTAICADLHLGFEAALAAAGTPMPDFTAPALRNAWKKMLACAPRRIVVAGDLFHTDDPGPATVALARELLESAGVAVTVIPGNHDPAPAEMQRLFDPDRVSVNLSATIGDYVVLHGHLLPEGAKRGGGPPLIVGHQHPAVVLADRVQSARMICFAVARVRGRGPAVMLPAFSPAPLGTNLLSGRQWILDLPRPTAEEVEIAGIVGEQVLGFGRLSGLGG